MAKDVQNLDDVTIRFAGDSGDGMQLTGMQFTSTTAFVGNDLSTLPDYPAEIRAPAGTLFGVSGFQIHFGTTEINTPGDTCDVLVAMNPAALKVNLRSLRKGGIIIANSDGFNEKNLRLAGYEANPLEDDSLDQFQLHSVNITQLTQNALADLGLSTKVTDRSKNFFALGMMYWMFSRPVEPTLKWIGEKFAKTPEVMEANIRVLKAGVAYGETTEIFAVRYEVKPASLSPGRYRSITGNEATAWGFIAASVKSRLELFLGSYPITPASDILHELSRHKNFHVKTFQAEDEIAGITSAIGASYGGSLGITTTSGPGMALKSEAMGLAVMLELPLVICDVQRGGPSTGLPTKTEQADLLQAIHGRNSEAPIPVIAALSPADCFATAFEASRIALTYMTPVIFLSDGYLANGAEPWLIPDVSSLPDIGVTFRTDPKGFFPYLRDEKTLARPWAVPGTPGLEHRIGGLEKQHITGNVSYDAENHEFMVRIRQEKIDRIAEGIPAASVEGPSSGELLVVGWGGTYGAIRTAVEVKRREGKSVSHLHLKYLNPFQKNLPAIFSRFRKVLVPELNLGQLSQLLKSRYLLPTVSLTKIQGLPFRSVEIENAIDDLLK
ncbi:MAG TPA: 2-oxoacid:acceptor oxidoreductase subunit alpha [Bacteroidota bacterium]|nr:2-oxoacid:acceptor oxidoreductase subunit alpha [Bacteroidota bacterium]